MQSVSAVFSQYLPSDYPDLCNVSRNKQSLSGSVLRKLHLTRLDRADRPVGWERKENANSQINDALWLFHFVWVYGFFLSGSKIYAVR